jgi:hypothetical protein
MLLVLLRAPEELPAQPPKPSATCKACSASLRPWNVIGRRCLTPAPQGQPARLRRLCRRLATTSAAMRQTC